MKKLIKDWWPLLLIAGWWLWKKTKRNPIVKQKTEATQSDDIQRYVGKWVRFNLAPGAYPIYISGGGGAVSGYGIRNKGINYLNVEKYVRDGDIRRIAYITSHKDYIGPDYIGPIGGAMNPDDIVLFYKISFAKDNSDFISVPADNIGKSVFLTIVDNPAPGGLEVVTPITDWRH